MDLPQVWTEDTGTGWPQLLTRRENQNVKWNHPNLGAFEKSGPSPCNSPAANLTVWPLPSPGVPPPGQALCRLQKSETGHRPAPGLASLLCIRGPCDGGSLPLRTALPWGARHCPQPTFSCWQPAGASEPPGEPLPGEVGLRNDSWVRARHLA